MEHAFGSMFLSSASRQRRFFSSSDFSSEVLDDVPSKDDRGPSSVRGTLELFQKQRWGSFLKDRVERIWAFPSA